MIDISSKAKIIMIAIGALVLVSLVVGLFIYINNLNDEISELSVTVESQSNTIDTLSNNVDVLGKSVKAFSETIDITNKYMSDITKIYNSSDNIKNDIYHEVISNGQASDWFNEKVNADILNIINGNHGNFMCKDNN